ncbi:HpcH/HpaI aldolase family protein [Aquirhabdus parva]|uniref:Aldolase n=1 Tax=Aquirhabdus parva TaxID=2283318 RepID=A0A345P7D2_9GAMM|nr:aldolase/citrate lyase family protein [Aquirhabdus parva]AXI03191.1 aldolase [Aquirhabdus parva]
MKTIGLKEKLATKSCIGIFSKTTDSAFVEAAGLGGLDFIILDTEHGPSSLETLHNHVRAAKLTPMASIIRVKGVDAHAIGSALDTGADGIQVPNIATAAQAAEVVQAARFFPIGSRGVCRFVRAAGFGTQDRTEYFAEANRKLVVLQVEGLEGIANLDEILDVVGFDILFVGPYDLSQSVGKPGEIEAPEVIELMRTIEIKAKAKGIVLGTFSDTPRRSRALKEQGFVYIAHSVDINVYSQACSDLVEMIR